MCQHDYLLPPQLAKRLLYSRFINTKGQRGKNIPADLYNEHLNKACNTALGHLGQNTSINHIQVVSRSLGTLLPILENFDRENAISLNRGKHVCPSLKKDIHLIVGQLIQSEVFKYKKGRVYKSFKTIKPGLHVNPKDEIIDWISSNMPCT